MRIRGRRRGAAAFRSLRLRAGGLVRLTEPAGVRRVEVLRGTLWLTETPARGDVLLAAGERRELTGGWPVVFEAMDDAVVILRSGGHA